MKVLVSEIVSICFELQFFPFYAVKTKIAKSLEIREWTNTSSSIQYCEMQWIWAKNTTKKYCKKVANNWGKENSEKCKQSSIVQFEVCCWK